MGYSWQMALAAVFVEGIIFIILSLTSVREAIFNAIPMNPEEGSFRPASASISALSVWLRLMSS